MKHQSYYRNPNGLLDAEADDRYDLQVNCAGLCRLGTPYRTALRRPDYYLQYCTEGEISVRLPDGEVRLLPGQALLIAPNVSYVCRSDACNTTYYWVHFTGANAEDLLRRFRLDCNKVHTVGLSERIPHLFRTLFQEYLWRDRCFEDSCRACLIRILAEICRSMDRNSRSGDRAAEVIYRSLSYFHDNIDKPVSVAKLAEIEHFSPSRYRTVFHTCMGLSPSEYMTGMRMRRACEMLSQTDRPVREIAEACGYRDQLYFSRVFRAHFGVAPSLYRTTEESSEKDGK